MALRRKTTAIDGTIPVPALLYSDEEICGKQEGVGIYDGIQKAPSFQAGTVYVTSHRLFYVNNEDALNHSFALDLICVVQTDHYAGLFTSSPKITLHLTGNSSVPSNPANHETGDNIGFDIWECEVCGNRNPPGLSPAASRICSLCGVPRSSTATTSSASRLVSTSPPPLSIYSPSPPAEVACPACTFLNHPSLLQCELCSTELSHQGPRQNVSFERSSTSHPSAFENDDKETTWMIKLSFRKGGDKLFYSLLKRTLKNKAWEDTEISGHSLQPQKGIESTFTEHKYTPGISGVLQSVEYSTQGRKTGMQNALQDLEALMDKAKDMVRLAAELNEKLTVASRSTSPPLFSAHSTPPSSSPTAPPPIPFSPSQEPEEVTFIRSSLSQLGLQMPNAPVTLDMIKDERKWLEELSKELAGILLGSSEQLTGGILKNRGIIALDEVWGGWNRARGVALIPPQTLLQVLPSLPQYTTPPIQTRILTSGLQILHTPEYSHVAFKARLTGMLLLNGSMTTSEVASVEDVTVFLAGEMIEEAESDGAVCRDDVWRTGVGSELENKEDGSRFGGSGEIRWWNNIFLSYAWDGQV